MTILIIGKYVEHLEHSFIVGEVLNGTTVLENNLFLIKFKMYLPYNLPVQHKTNKNMLTQNSDASVHNNIHLNIPNQNISQLVNKQHFGEGIMIEYYWYIQHIYITSSLVHITIVQRISSCQELDGKKIIYFMILFTNNFRKGKTIGTESRTVFPCN